MQELFKAFNHLEDTIECFDKYVDHAVNSNMPTDGTDRLTDQVNALTAALNEWMAQ